MGGYDIGLSLSGSSSASSGIGPQNFGAISAGGGLKIPTWLPIVAIGALVIVVVTWLATRK